MSWTMDFRQISFFMWLYGPATGAPSHSQSLNYATRQRLPVSSFLVRLLVATTGLASPPPWYVNSACLCLLFENTWKTPLSKTPWLCFRSLEAQIHSLVVDLLPRALSNEDAISLRSGPKLIITDSLDECGGGEVQCYVLSTFVTAVQGILLSILFLVASRPEQTIRDAFNAEPLRSTTRRLALDESYRSDDDIKLFLQSKFDEIKQNHPLRDLLPPEWPSDSDLVRRAKKSSGQFIYASTVMKYLNSPHHWPTDALDIIFGLLNPGVDTPFAQLDDTSSQKSRISPE